MDFSLCGFKVLDSYFNRWEMQEVKGHTINIVMIKKTGKTISGDDEKIDKLFKMHISWAKDQCDNWTE